MKKILLLAFVLGTCTTAVAQEFFELSSNVQFVAGLKAQNIALQQQVWEKVGFELSYQSNDFRSPEADGTDTFPDRLTGSVYYKHTWNEKWSSHLGAGLSVSGRGVQLDGQPFRGNLTLASYYHLNEAWSIAAQYVMVANKVTETAVYKEPSAFGIGVRFKFVQY